ncbi:MAG: CinA family protein [Streptomycetales bacterium]
MLVHSLLRRQDATVAAAESLTGGLVAAALTAVPGSSATFRGGVVAYAPDLKAGLLGVDPALLSRRGAVAPDVARAMALGVRERLSATYGVATTGVAGPESQDGQSVGTVHLAVSGPGGVAVASLHLPGDRRAVREACVTGALDLLARRLSGDPPADEGQEEG